MEINGKYMDSMYMVVSVAAAETYTDDDKRKWSEGSFMIAMINVPPFLTSILYRCS